MVLVLAWPRARDRPCNPLRPKHDMHLELSAAVAWGSSQRDNRVNSRDLQCSGAVRCLAAAGQPLSEDPPTAVCKPRLDSRVPSPNTLPFPPASRPTCMVESKPISVPTNNPLFVIAWGWVGAVAEKTTCLWWRGRSVGVLRCVSDNQPVSSFSASGFLPPSRQLGPRFFLTWGRRKRSPSWQPDIAFGRLP
ncbi:hypothetical protein P171DRAFT_225135 [Karstenula rhodostoma CBS 690.94]|uniref:Uncharacterized protein n=1 Tax=Karstenula rhodostoma CBS 690.94 TaxID=1392251 RepID=A0A9P4PLR7_9PLEO|nr:hypothetical protein P171DRAFT_225135 [Karstenula rhodostoma CBS 690.94]